MDEQQPEIRGPAQPGDLPGFLALLAGIVARRLKEEAQERQQEPSSNMVQLRRRTRKRTAS